MTLSEVLIGIGIVFVGTIIIEIVAQKTKRKWGENK